MFGRLFILFSVAVAVVFACFPELDIFVSKLFYRDGEFFLKHEPIFEFMHDVIVPLTIVTVIVLLALLIYTYKGRKIGKYLDKKAAIFLLVYLITGPAVVTNLVFKEYSGRVRPVNSKFFGGEHKFTPYYDFSGKCDHNCSFISGHVGGAMFFLALAYVFRNRLILVLSLSFVALMALTRVVQGAHFLSDVLFAIIVNFIILKLVYYLIYKKEARLEE